MPKQSLAHGPSVPLFWPAAFLGSAGAAGLWLVLAQGRVDLLLAAMLPALAAALGGTWLSRARAAWRVHAVADTFATREIARERLERSRGGARQRERSAAVGQ
jgi:hypothetical protein